MKTPIDTPFDTSAMLATLASKLQEHLAQRQLAPEDITLIGIHTGGAWIAEALHAKIQPRQPLGLLDISFYRDDFTQKGLNPRVQASDLPSSLENHHIVLVDDVIMSGRTIRAALNELFDYGRPASVILACLVSLPGRELPIQPDVIGETLDLSPQERVKLSGPDPLQLELRHMEHP